jgi:hypothetical protein
MLTHSQVQVKAQQELDSVVGRDRLPEFSDRASLPYVNAILKEVLRLIFLVTLHRKLLICLIQLDGTLWLHWVCPTWQPRMTIITVISFQQGPLSSEILCQYF